VSAGNLIPIGAPDVKPTILVWGDSHAMAAMPAFDALLKEKELSGRAVTHSATAPVLDWFLPTTKDGMSRNAIPFNDAVFSYIQSSQIRDVILVAAWIMYVERGEQNTATFHPSLTATIKRLNDEGCRVWVMLEVPETSLQVPKVLAQTANSPEKLTPFYPKPAKQRNFNAQEIAEMQIAGARILDPKPRFFHEEKQHYIIELEGVSLYSDSSHLSIKGAKLILLPFLRDSLVLVN
jgi:hypothetical protein